MFSVVVSLASHERGLVEGRKVYEEEVCTKDCYQLQAASFHTPFTFTAEEGRVRTNSTLDLKAIM